MEEQYQYTKTKEIFSREKDLPKLPGVYKFYDEKNKILYIGKAKNLSNRLKSYLSRSKDRKKNELIDKISDNAGWYIKSIDYTSNLLHPLTSYL